MSRKERQRRNGATEHRNHHRDHHASSEEAFVCERCGRSVVPSDHGTRHRNHCPYCLWSRHMDRKPGDRLSSCRGLMAPVAVWSRDGEWNLIHRCERCSALRSNRIAPDDDLAALLALAAEPLAAPPVPKSPFAGRRDAS